MSYPSRLFFRSLVKPFYKENLSIFFFLFILMFGVVGEVDGAELFQFHYSLATGMLQNRNYLLFVFVAWLLYTRKCIGFVSGLLQKPQYAFISIYNNLDRVKQFRLFLRVEIWLLLPILLYAVFIAIIGWYGHLFVPVLVVWGYLLSLCIIAALWQVYLLHNLYGLVKINFRWTVFPAYEFVLLRFVAYKQRIMWVGIKLFTCGVLYLIAQNNTAGDYETVFPFLFFNFGVLADGIIVHAVREFEEASLTFYRGLPVSLLKRWTEYSLVYFVLLIPEFITASLLVPVHLHEGDAILFSLSAYGLVLFMNSITFLRYFGRKEYFVLLLIVFGVQYFFLACIGLAWMCLVLFAAAIVFFLAGFYRFERSY